MLKPLPKVVQIILRQGNVKYFFSRLLQHIGLFSIALHKIIDLYFLGGFCKLASFLPVAYCFSTIAIALVFASFFYLKGIEKRQSTLFAFAKQEKVTKIAIEREIKKRSKVLIPRIKQRAIREIKKH